MMQMPENQLSFDDVAEDVTMKKEDKAALMLLFQLLCLGPFIKTTKC